MPNTYLLTRKRRLSGWLCHMELSIGFQRCKNEVTPELFPRVGRVSFLQDVCFTECYTQSRIVHNFENQEDEERSQNYGSLRTFASCQVNVSWCSKHVNSKYTGNMALSVKIHEHTPFMHVFLVCKYTCEVLQ